MKAILEFELPQEENKYRIAMNGFKYCKAILTYKETINQEADRLFRTQEYDQNTNSMVDIAPEQIIKNRERALAYKNAIANLHTIITDFLT